jgi:hypothetical protein
VFGNIPGTKQITPYRPGHKIIVKPSQKIQSDSDPKIYKDTLTPEQQPPAQAYYYLADNKDTENSGKNPHIHLAENFHQPVPSLLAGNPKPPPNHPAHNNRNTQKKEYAFTFFGSRFGH